MPGSGWVRAAASDDVGRQPLAVRVEGVDVVLWRGPAGRLGVFVDRCPHQGFPLSTGRRTVRGRLRCAEHNWEFAVDGACVSAPHRTPQELAGRRAVVVPSREHDGAVWLDEVVLATLRPQSGGSTG